MPERGIFLGQQLKAHLRVVQASPKAIPPPHLIRSLCHRVPRRAPRTAHTAASAQRRNQTPPRSPALTLRCISLTRSPSVQKRVHPRRSSRTKQTNTSPKSPAKNRPSPSMHLCSLSSRSNAHQKQCRQHPGTCFFSHSF